VVDKVTDPVIKDFWTKEYAKYTQKFEVEAVSPIQNKVGQFLTNPLIRNIVGQKKSSIDIRKIMDEKKILVVNLSKGRIGEDTAKLLGAMIITKIQLAAMSRIDVPEEERKDFFVYIDEFQNFATESFADILAEARKYRLNLILAHQYIAQLEDTGVKEAVMGNVGTLALFRVGAEDAEFFEKEFAPQVDVQNLVNLPNRKIYLKLMIDGVASSAFSADTLTPLKEEEESNEEEILKFSTGKYSREREVVEKEISEWIGPQEEIVSEDKPKVKLYDTTCSKCKKITQVPFVPDKNRDVFCKECYADVQRDQAKNPPVKAAPKRQREVKVEVPKLKKPEPKADKGELKTLETKDEAMSLSDAFKVGSRTFSGKKISNEEDTKKEEEIKSGVLKPGESIKL